jgi:hypothetical protein
MSKDLNINVNVNPNGVSSPTQTRITETPQATDIRNRTAQNAAVTAVIVQAAQRGLSLATAQIGELTGNKTLQRNVQTATSIGVLGILAVKNPLTAAAFAAFDVGSTAVTTAITNRNQQIQRDYNRQLRLATHNNGRR